MINWERIFQNPQRHWETSQVVLIGEEGHGSSPSMAVCGGRVGGRMFLVQGGAVGNGSAIISPSNPVNG